MKLILDFDTGIDDAAMHLLGEDRSNRYCPVFGNAEVDKCVHNTRQY